MKTAGHKARRGRKGNPVPHGPHRNRGAINDPLTRAVKRQAGENRERARRPRNPADLELEP